MTFTLINEQNGNLAFKLFSFDDNSYFDHLQRNNYYSLIWIKKGNGKLKMDFSDYHFEKDSLFAFSPYQPFMISSETIKGIAIYFHSDFFCIHKHQTEVTCNSVLFNNIYQSPILFVEDDYRFKFETLIEEIKSELQNPRIAQYELLISYMKILLISASRLKIKQQPDVIKEDTEPRQPLILQSLKDAIEENFKSKHSTVDYANVLNISQNALAKTVKKHFNKTLTDLISERIIIEAKRELYLTNKAVKEIAHELGYEDEHYFSRFFKKNTDITPQTYRETVGFGKAETENETMLFTKSF